MGVNTRKICSRRARSSKTGRDSRAAMPLSVVKIPMLDSLFADVAKVESMYTETPVHL